MRRLFALEFVFAKNDLVIQYKNQIYKVRNASKTIAIS
jgi:hypothetical protein